VEFTLICPNDGRVELGLDDISAIVFRDADSVEVVFVCPTCGSKIRAMLHVPNLMLAAMELARYAEELRDTGAGGGDPTLTFSRHEDASDADEVDEAELEVRRGRERAGEPYCEYFRRQLARVECVEDLLGEMD
jgi:hypothetical protein